MRIARPFLWLALTAIVVFGIWLLDSDLHNVSQVTDRVIGLLLFVVGLLAGLRIGTSHATRFVRDLLRLNRYLTDQHNELCAMNSRLLKSVAEKHENAAAHKELQSQEE